MESNQYTVCPKCNGDYWADPFRKCSNCLNGRVMRSLDQRRENIETARKRLVQQITDLEVRKLELDNTLDALEQEQMDQECSICGDDLDDDDRGKCKECQAIERAQHIAEYGEVDERDYRAGRGLPR